MPPNYLHLWPRDEFTLIALANKDRTFTLTLFAPFKVFDQLATADDQLEFFAKNFPDALDLLRKQ